MSKEIVKESFFVAVLGIYALLIVLIIGAGAYGITHLTAEIHWAFAFLFPFYLWLVIYILFSLFGNPAENYAKHNKNTKEEKSE